MQKALTGDVLEKEAALLRKLKEASESNHGKNCRK